jgi:hypothetical protein
MRLFTRIAAIVWGVAILPALFVAWTTVFILIAPGAIDSQVTMLFVAGFWLLPVVCLVALVVGLLCSRRSASRTTRRIGLAIVSVPLIDLAFILVMLGVLQAWCGGMFDCRVR